MGRNRDAETAFQMAMTLATANGQSVSEGVRQSIWDKCHADTELHTLVSRYLISDFSYAPRALYNLHQRIMEIIKQELEVA